MSSTFTATIPAELVSAILDELTCGKTWYFLTCERFQVAKAGLAACSLTCRHWARLIRPILFRSIILRTHEDVVFLRKLLQTPAAVGPALVDCLEAVEIQQAEPVGVPWTHHVQGILERAPKAWLRIVITGTSSPHNISPAVLSSSHLPFHRLPRTLPGSSLKVLTLSIKDVELRSKTELARLIDSLSTLRNCYCDKLTFLDSSPSAQAPRRGGRPTHVKLRSLMVSRCEGTEDLETQLALASYILDAPSRLRLDGETWDLVLRAMAGLVLYANPKASISIKLEADCFATAFVVVYGDYKATDEYICATVTVHTPPATADPAVRSTVEGVELEFEPVDAELLQSVRWQPTEDMLRSPLVPNLTLVCTDHGRVSLAAFTWLSDAVHRGTTLAQAVCHRKLQLAYRWILGNKDVDRTVSSEDILKYGSTDLNFSVHALSPGSGE